MIILTAKLPKFNFSTAVVAATALCSGFLVFSLAKAPYEATMASDHSVKTQNQRLAYLQEWGWEVEETALSSQTLLIPDLLDESYDAYVALQTAQGFPPLSQFQGETVERYTYAVTNYPTGEEGIQVNLLLFQGEVIGGEVLSPTVNGILHGLEKPSETLSE
ncbi:MAG: DUF4830 domain-containing protein [Eubacteriales bacterium]